MVDTEVETKGRFQRVEVLVGSKRRREWSVEAKGRIVADSLKSGEGVSEVARRHGLRPQQLFAWRHAAKKGELVLPGEEAMSFVPISLADDRVEKSAEKSGFGADVIEIEVAGAVVRARSGIDLGFLSSVLRAIRLSI
jgi:transposase